jgi:hypothetical protein
MMSRDIMLAPLPSEVGKPPVRDDQFTPEEMARIAPRYEALRHKKILSGAKNG